MLRRYPDFAVFDTQCFVVLLVVLREKEHGGTDCEYHHHNARQRGAEAGEVCRAAAGRRVGFGLI